MQAAAALVHHPARLAAAAEVTEKAGRAMRLAAGGWAEVMWVLLGSLEMHMQLQC